MLRAKDLVDGVTVAAIPPAEAITVLPAEPIVAPPEAEPVEAFRAEDPIEPTAATTLIVTIPALAAIPAVVAPVSAVAPVMTARPTLPAVVSGLLNSLTGLISGGDRVLPVGAPAVWAIAAAARNEIGATAATAAPAAVVTSSAPPSPAPAAASQPPAGSYRQITTPNFSPARGPVRGLCLRWVDDTVNAPKRSATAQIAYNTQKAAGNIRAGDPPVGVWAPVFFSIGSGANAGQGHVAWAFNKGNGTIEIRDTETETGARARYTSIGQVTSWFSKSNIKYLGWSTSIDGVEIVRPYSLNGTVYPNISDKTACSLAGNKSGCKVDQITASVLYPGVSGTSRTSNKGQRWVAIPAPTGQGTIVIQIQAHITNPNKWVTYQTAAFAPVNSTSYYW